MTEWRRISQKDFYNRILPHDYRMYDVRTAEQKASHSGTIRYALPIELQPKDRQELEKLHMALNSEWGNPEQTDKVICILETASDAELSALSPAFQEYFGARLWILEGGLNEFRRLLPVLCDDHPQCDLASSRGWPSQITAGLFLGGIFCRDPLILQSLNITHILSITNTDPGNKGLPSPHSIRV